MKKIERIIGNNDAKNYIAAVKSEAIALVKTVQSQTQAQSANNMINLVSMPASMPASFFANNHIIANSSLVVLPQSPSPLNQLCQHLSPVQ